MSGASSGPQVPTPGHVRSRDDSDGPEVVRRARVEEACRSTSSSSSSSSSVNPFTRLPFSASYQSLLRTREQLPVFRSRRDIQEAVQHHPVTVLVGETGSGKTTQVPHFLAEMQSIFAGRIVCTQPRRIAAISVASRVAAEMDVRLGEEVGYHVRFRPVFDQRRTKVLYMTDGLLLRECMSDPLLRSMSVVVVDEVHERTKSTDIALGLLRRILAQRADMRVVVMSATLDVDKFMLFFPSAKRIAVPGRTFPVQVYYLPEAVSDYVETAVDLVAQLHAKEPPGDILCFLTSEAEIRRAVQQTQQHLSRPAPGSQVAEARGATVLPLYGALPLEEQQKVFAAPPPGVRKIVFSTNIAETSVTVNGVVYVVDSCYQKQTLYNAGARIEYLLPAVISKASAEQRRGRAGRTCPGKCYRLVPQKDYEQFPAQTFPEMLRSSLIDAVLLLLEVGVDNPCQFDFLDPPTAESLQDAFFQLLLFGTVDENLQLTELGRQMGSLPVDAAAARMLLRAKAHGCAADATVIVAMAEGGATLSAGRSAGATSRFSHPDGDHLSQILVFHEVLRHNKSPTFCADNGIRFRSMESVFGVYDQLRQQVERLGVPFLSTYRNGALDSVALRKAVLEGLFLQVAMLVSPQEGVYRTVCDSINATVHRDSVLHHRVSGLPTWVMYDRLEVQADEMVVMRRVTEVEVEWLLDVSDFYAVGDDIQDRDIAFALQRARSLRSV